jgi:hypothetical protein
MALISFSSQFPLPIHSHDGKLHIYAAVRTQRCRIPEIQAPCRQTQIAFLSSVFSPLNGLFDFLALQFALKQSSRNVIGAVLACIDWVLVWSHRIPQPFAAAFMPGLSAGAVSGLPVTQPGKFLWSLLT